MILEEETYKQFGYYPKDLSEKSGKKIVAKCDDCGKIRLLRRFQYRPFCLKCVNRGERHPLYGKHISEETKKKIREANLGKKQSEETKRKRSESMKGKYIGRKLSEGTKRKISEANTGKRHTEETKKKMSESRKGEKNHFFGKHHTEESRKKMSESLKGREVWNKGIPRSEETKEKIRKALTGKPMSEETKRKLREIRGSKEGREKCREARKCAVFSKHHTLPESLFKEISERLHVPSQYKGDGKLWIGKKGEEQLNPDFIIEVNGKRYVVEIFGDYWHSPLLNHSLRENATLAYRKKFFKKHGWVPIFIWESDLKREDAEAFVLNLLKKKGVIK